MLYKNIYVLYTFKKYHRSLLKSLTFFSNLNIRENPRINIIVVDLVIVTLGRNIMYFVINSILIITIRLYLQRYRYQ